MQEAFLKKEPRFFLICISIRYEGLWIWIQSQKGSEGIDSDDEINFIQESFSFTLFLLARGSRFERVAFPIVWNETGSNCSSSPEPEDDGI